MIDKPKLTENQWKVPESRFVEQDFNGIIFDHSKGDGVKIDFTEPAPRKAVRLAPRGEAKARRRRPQDVL